MREPLIAAALSGGSERQRRTEPRWEARDGMRIVSRKEVILRTRFSRLS